MLVFKYNPSESMEEDLKIFQEFNGLPFFKVYNFACDCITFGYFQNKNQIFNLDLAKRLKIEIVKRPTGGGIVFHSKEDIIFSSVCKFDLFQNNFRNAYNFFSYIVLDALKQFNLPVSLFAQKNKISTADKLKNYCFSFSQEYEIVLGNKKLVGIAQKRDKNKVLIQGAIKFAKPESNLFSVLKDRNSLDEAYIANFDKKIKNYEIIEVLKDCFTKTFARF